MTNDALDALSLALEPAEGSWAWQQDEEVLLKELRRLAALGLWCFLR